MIRRHLPFPQEEFRINTVSVYHLDDISLDYKLLCQRTLGAMRCSERRHRAAVPFAAPRGPCITPALPGLGRPGRVETPDGTGRTSKIPNAYEPWDDGTGPDPQGQLPLLPGRLIPHVPHASARVTARVAPQKTIDFIGSARVHGYRVVRGTSALILILIFRLILIFVPILPAQPRGAQAQSRQIKVKAFSSLVLVRQKALLAGTKAYWRGIGKDTSRDGSRSLCH